MHRMTMEEFRAARDSLGLSQTQMAGLMGVDAKTIKNYESGARGIRKPVALLVEALQTGWRPDPEKWGRAS